MLTARSVSELLDAFSQPSPTPGGGSASALAGAVGASLLIMVASLPKNRGGEGGRDALAEAAGELRHLGSCLRDRIDLDSGAYEAVVAAYKLPKGTDLEESARREAVQDALKEATEIPLAVMECCARGLDIASIVALHGNRSAASDVGVGVELLGAGLRGAHLNVAINLASLADASYAESVRTKADGLARAGAEQTSAVLELLRS